MDLRYPIGPFQYLEPVTPDERLTRIESIAAAPARLRAAVAGLDDRQLDTPYRPEGWTVRQLVHHVVDSHMNAYIRCKLTLTEDHPTIKPYDEAAWARLPDSNTPVEGALTLLDQLHGRWAGLLRAIPPEGFARTCFHPESKLVFSLDRLAGFYAWHGAHHTAHATELRKREAW